MLGHLDKAKSILSSAIQSGIEPKTAMESLLNSWDQENDTALQHIHSKSVSSDTVGDKVDKENVYPGKSISKDTAPKRLALQPKTKTPEISTPSVESNEPPNSR